MVLMLGVLCGLIYSQPHWSAIVIIIGIGAVMMYIGGANLFWLGLGGGTAAVGLVTLMLTMAHSSAPLTGLAGPLCRSARQRVPGHPVFPGDRVGRHLGRRAGAEPAETTLDRVFNDFIFSVWCEEMGLIGALLVIALFVALIMRGYYIAMRAGDKFGTLLAAGVTTQIALQTIFNLFVVTGLAPVTGASLPFFSYGGTSLMMLLAEVGIVLSVSRRIPAPRQG